MNNFNILIEGLNNNGKLLKGKDFNPKKEGVNIGPLSAICYYTPTNLGNIKYEYVDIETGKTNNLGNTNIYSMKNITKQETEKLTRTILDKIDFVNSKLFTNKDNQYDIILEIETKNGFFKPIVFPREDSNIGIFCNKDNKTSFVIDGRCIVVNKKLYNLSSTQEAINKYIDSQIDGETKLSLKKFISKEYWQIKNEDGVEETGDEDQSSKALIWIGYTKYMNFPQMDDGTPYNVIWSNNDSEATILDIALKYELRKYMRYSSLSQNGTTALGGLMLDRKIFNGKLLFEVGEVKQFKGTKGKLDVSATQGPKNFKRYFPKATGRCLVVLAELYDKNGNAINLQGNAISNESAFRQYVSALTFDKATEAYCRYPSNKVFIKVNGETVRIKGASSIEPINFIESKDGYKDDCFNSIVVLPPREYNPDGSIETDYSKFEYLCKYRTKDSKLGLYTIELYGEKYTVPGLICEVVEDAYHSAVYSIKLKPQNLFYYGAINSIYQFNGKDNMFKALNSLLDNDRLSHALNFCKLSKENIVEINYMDFINNLK